MPATKMPTESRPGAATTADSVDHERVSELVPDARPEEVMDKIRSLISVSYPRARKLAAEAVARFPEHKEIASAHRVLNSPTGPVGTAPSEPATDEEFDWLRNPPDCVRGKWVALSGRKVLAVADKLADLVKTLQSHDPRPKALVHRVE